LVPVSILLGVCSAAVAGAMMVGPIIFQAKVDESLLPMQKSMLELNHRIDIMDSGINARLRALEERVSDRWTRTDMRTWVREFQAMNESKVRVPEIER
jgi:hypothetical protein